MAKTAMLFLAMAMLMAAPTASRAAGDHAIRVATVVCTGGGCNVVHTKQIKHRNFKPMEYTKPLPKAS